MRVDVLSKEYPPEIYGGAGVHVAELVRALRRRGDLDTRVHAFGAPRDEPGTSSYPDHAELAAANAALRTLGVDLSIADACAGTDLVHSHTWYANMAGHLASLLYGVPHVVSAHSLEPMRPWKAEQLGGGYAVSSWVERTSYLSAAAVIAVSAAMRDDVLRSYPEIDPGRVQVVHNGIDTDDWAPVHDPDRVRRHGVDPDRASVVFVGRITRQKGLPLFLRA
ncbi:MAG: glycogen synthase, partial [Nocardioides sp.]